MVLALPGVLSDLGPGQLAILAALWLTAIVFGTVHWYLLHKATRSRIDGNVEGRPFSRGFGVWHVGMLRRGWLPEEGRYLHPWILGTYFIGLASTFTAFLLLVVWLIL